MADLMRNLLICLLVAASPPVTAQSYDLLIQGDRVIDPANEIDAVRQGFLPDTISTDIHKNSIMLPHATLTNVMSRFLNIGMTLEQVIERTTVNSAKAIRRLELGNLDEGGVADIAVLELERGRFAFLDSGRAKHIGDRRLNAVLTVRAGEIVWDLKGLLLQLSD